ncbi:MAG: T9SS type A sorting domain-containing protein, partial [Cytophagaceae bacterium]
VIPLIDSLARLIEPEIKEHIDRWRRPGSKLLWDLNVEEMKDFIYKRPCYIRKHIAKEFDLFDNPEYEKLLYADCEKFHIEEKELEYSVIPNPNSGRFTIRYESSSETQLNYHLINSVGVQIYKGTFPGSQGINHIDVATNRLPPGIYFLLIMEGDKVKSTKILIH